MRIGSRRHQLELERADHRGGDVVLHLENVLHVAIIGLRPKMHAVVGADQLRADAHRVGRAAHAALEHVRHPKGAGNFLERGILVSEVKR